MLLKDFGVKLMSCLCENAASSVCLPDQNDGPSQKRLVPRSAGACPPLASEPGEGQALALRDWRMAQSVCSLSSPELKQNPRYPEPDQNDGPSQKLFVPRSAGACPPHASEPCEGQALALLSLTESE